MSEWIKVSDRLPDSSELVIICLCNTVVGMGHYNHGKKIWRSYTDMRSELHGVTHWQPRPEAPHEP